MARPNSVRPDASTPDRRTYCTIDPTCSRCGSLVLPTADGEAWRCTDCEHTRPRSRRERFVSTLKQVAHSPTIIDTDAERGLPTTDERCPDCGHDEAYWDLQQLRAADEPATLLFICTSCGHSWREDD